MKDRILKAAEIEINLHGPSFRMDDLAKRMSISKRTLYENFTSKNEIIETILTERLEGHAKRAEAILNNEKLSCREKLIEVFTVKSEEFSSISGTRMRDMFNRMPFLISHLTGLSEKHWVVVENYLIKEQKAGVIRDLSVPVLVAMLKGLVNSILNDSTRNPDECSEVLHDAIQILLDGIMTE